jgi:hypothetical protein
MTESPLEQFLASVASRLAVPPARREEIVSELRAHLYADFADRLAAGHDEAAAVRDTVAEMGASAELALQLNREHALRGSALRLTLAVEILLLGSLFGLAGPSNHWCALPWPPALILALSSLLAAAFLAGYVARRGGLILGLIPGALLLPPALLMAAAGMAPPETSTRLPFVLLLISVAAPVAGHFGTALSLGGTRLGRVLALLAACWLAALMAAALISALIGGAILNVLRPMALAVLLVTLTWSAMRIVEDAPQGRIKPADGEGANSLL